MKNVVSRLNRADVGKVTQVIEQDIIDTLRDMIDALKKAVCQSHQRASVCK